MLVFFSQKRLRGLIEGLWVVVMLIRERTFQVLLASLSSLSTGSGSNLVLEHR